MVAELKVALERLRERYAVPEDTRPIGDCTSDAEGWDGYPLEGN